MTFTEHDIEEFRWVLWAGWVLRIQGFVKWPHGWRCVSIQGERGWGGGDTEMWSSHEKGLSHPEGL